MRKHKHRSILFLVPYPLAWSPSQRFRFEQYLEILRKNGHTYRIQSFLDPHNWRLFFAPGKIPQKIFALVKGFSKRLFILFRAVSYDFVFIHREASPIGPPIIEWLLARVLRRKIIYDFDDAIWLTDRNQELKLMGLIKCRNKVKYICRWSFKISCGNSYLCAYASKYNKQVIYIPTTIDTKNWHNPRLFPVRKDSNYINIGWTGSHSTLKYLNTIESVLVKIVDLHPFVNFIVIADQQPVLALPVNFIPWNQKTEIDDLLKIDIGIMPLPDDEWSKGKCGFKALQYMALGIPAITSPVGANMDIIKPGVNGFLADSQEQWYDFINMLIKDEALRKTIGEQGRKKVIEYYSVQSNSSTFLSLFE